MEREPDSDEGRLYSGKDSEADGAATEAKGRKGAAKLADRLEDHRRPRDNEAGFQLPERMEQVADKDTDHSASAQKLAAKVPEDEQRQHRNSKDTSVVTEGLNRFRRRSSAWSLGRPRSSLRLSIVN